MRGDAPLSLPLAFLFLIFISHLYADTIVLTPVADTMLSQNFPSNNFGAMLFVNSGTTQNYTTNRALFRFDLTSIPAGSRIDAVSLKLEVVAEPNEPPPLADMSLHRLLVPWGEGRKLNSGNGAGNGSPATTNEATWIYRFAYTSNTWASPGGAAGIDFVATGSANNTIYGVSDYYFPPAPPATTPQLVADVQLWLDQPVTNFGWLLLCDNESTAFTARRYGSREDPVNTPLLTVSYTPLQLLNPVVTGNQFQASFSAAAGKSYVVEWRGFVNTSAWQTLTNFPVPSTPTNLSFTDILSATQRFYRVTTH